jgi:PAS domain S-box-containing protein
LHQLGLSPSKPPDAAGWHALLEELAATYERIDDGAGDPRSPSREMRFRMSQEPNRTVFEWCPAPLVLYNPETLEILDVNAAATHAYGYSRAELLAMRMSDLQAVPDASAADGLLEGKVVRNRVERHRKKDGSFAEVNVTAHILDFAGRSVALGIYTDMTETRRLEEQLRQSQKMEAVGRLAGGIAHDFNNLIGAILGYAEVTAQELGPNHPLTPDVREIAKAARRGGDLTAQLLAFSRQQPLQPKLLSVRDVVVDMRRMLARILGETVELTIEEGSTVGAVVADPIQIQQILLNLTANARDAMPGGGQVRVGVRDVDLSEISAAAIGVLPGPYARLSVRDSGAGMDATTRARVFEPFFTTKPVGSGTGLGLAIVFGIAKQSGGAVVVDSQPGKGSTFEVYFPRASGELAKAATPIPTTRAAGGAGTGERILLVDDDDQMRRAAKRVLSSQGYTVVDVADPREALEILRDTAQRISLVVTDFVMPHMDGPTMVAAARGIRPALRVLYISGYPELPGHPTLAPEESLLRKPFSTSTLANAVRGAMG